LIALDLDVDEEPRAPTSKEGVEVDILPLFCLELPEEPGLPQKGEADPSGEWKSFIWVDANVAHLPVTRVP